MLRKILAEMIGTFALLLIGPGAVVFGHSESGLIGVALAFGFIVVSMAYCLGPISGAHMNPAVSLAMYLNKRMNLKELVAYMAAQFVGAVAGSSMLRLFLSESGKDASNLGATILAENLTLFGGFVIEVVLTFIFVLVILAVTGHNGNSQMAGLVVGLTLVALILMGGTTTGVSLNPARSFGPAILMGGTALSQLWLYKASTLLGGTLASVAAKYVLGTESMK